MGDVVRQIDVHTLMPVGVAPSLDAGDEEAGGGVGFGDDLERALHGDPRSPGIGAGPDHDEGAAVHEGVDVGLGAGFVEAVGLPDAPKLALEVGPRGCAESLNVQALLLGAYGDAGPVDAHRRESVAEGSADVLAEGV